MGVKEVPLKHHHVSVSLDRRQPDSQVSGLRHEADFAAACLLRDKPASFAQGFSNVTGVSLQGQARSELVCLHLRHVMQLHIIPQHSDTLPSSLPFVPRIGAVPL
ncbi:hypothetical protein D3C73_1308700 [compost metagenome]